MGLFYVLCICIIMKNVLGRTSTAVPDNLINCYRRNVTENLPKPPLTTKLLVELIRKLELGKSLPHIRTLTNSILHTVKFDGIKRGIASEHDYLIPYRASGNHFHKYQFIVDHLTPGDTLQFPGDALNEQEFCILHYIISNTIDWREGDTTYTCPNRNSTDFNTVCPIEKGVLKSKWGSVSAGHLITGIASALQRDTVSLGQLIDAVDLKNNMSQQSRVQNVNNVWFSTIVGDLAEVLINQGLSPKLGVEGNWNDTLLPRNYYLDIDAWDMSGAELLGGIDGMLLANKINDWLGLLEVTRFSQLIDMYYSERGVGFDRSYKACERNKKLDELLNSIDLVEQVSASAKILQTTGRYGAYLAEETIDSLSNGIVDSYRAAAKSLSEKYSDCQQGGDNIGRLEIIVILDGTWTPYEILQFTTYLSEMVDVSYYGSKMGIINGENGEWLTNVTNNLLELYTDLSRQNAWPTRLSLTKSLHSIISYYQNKTKPLCDPYEKPYGSVILVMAQSTLLTNHDHETAISSTASIKKSNPETKIIYVTPEKNTFKPLERNRNAFSITTPKLKDITSIVGVISKELGNHPRSIINMYCNGSRSYFEDYLTPGLISIYEIRGEYMAAANISIKFKGNDYGEIIVCGYDVKKSIDKICKGITVNSEITFNIKDLCLESPCTVQFEVSANSSSLKCAEKDCRYPDQIRMNIYTSWNNANVLYVNYIFLTFIVSFLCNFV